MKKVIVLIPRFGVGGISKIGSFVANSLAKEFDTMIVSVIDDEISTAISNDIKIQSLDFSFDDPHMRCIKRFYFKARTIYRLRKIVKDNGVSLICSLGLDLGNIALIATKGLSCKCITSERGNPYRYDCSHRRKYNQVIKQSDAVVFQTRMAMKAFDNCGISSKAFIIQNPAIGRNSLSYNIKGVEREKRIVYCGRFSKDKNIDILIKAYSELCNKDYKLVIYGYGPEVKHINTLIEECGINDTTEIVQGCDDVFARESNSEIFVLTSNEEGMPNALIEAMMCGMTCIATDCPPGGCRELLEDGKRGILIPVNDIGALKNAINEVINNCDYSKKMGEAAQSISTTNSAEVIEKKWLDVVKSILI